MAMGDAGEEGKDAYAEAARAAAAAGDPEAMIDALYRSGFLDGLARRLSSDWGRLDNTDAAYIVSLAVEALYAAFRGPRRPLDIFGYLYVAARNKAVDLDRARKLEVRLDPEARNAAEARCAAADETPEADLLAQERAEQERRRALTDRLRALVRRLPQENMRSVLTYIIEAHGRDVYDLTAAEIGDALGLTPGNVRVLKKRGKDRLEAMIEAGEPALALTAADLQLADEGGDDAGDDE